MMKFIGKRNRNLVTERIAADTLILLGGEFNPEDEARLTRLSGNSADYRQGLLASTQLMAELEAFAEDSEIQSILHNYTARSSQRGRRRKSVLAITAVVVLSALASLLYIDRASIHSGSRIDRYTTRVGEQKEITLSDGTTITLNTGASLLVEMSDVARNVILERGEVYFDVSSDPLRPFSVSVGERSVSVLGTAFNILKSPDKFTLAVVEGVVAIHAKEEAASADALVLAPDNGDRVLLKSPGQRKLFAGTVAEYDYGTEELIAYIDSKVNKRQQWRSGVLVFEDVPLGEVVQELNRYSAKKILLESRVLMDKKIYAVIQINRLSVALETLQSTVPIKVVTHFDRIVISDRNH